jgi:hypothetical protein
MMHDNESEDFVSTLDTSVFQILTAASPNDRKSFLRLQRLTRRLCPSYSYLEIGSELGGSLLPHLLASACASVVSIDLRPLTMPDERAQYFDYPENAEQAMVNTLRSSVGETGIIKLTIFRRDASLVDLAEIPAKANLVLIDAEHTNVACFSDALSALRLAEPDAIISFHDANLISDAIQNFEGALRYLGIKFHTVFLPDCVAVIGLGSSADAVRDTLGPLSFDRYEYLPRVREERWALVRLSIPTAK